MESFIAFGSSNLGAQVGINSGQIVSAFSAGVPRSDRNGRKESFNVPFQRDKDFIGDQKLLDQVSNKLSIPGSRMALIGMGGIGKSHLAIESMYRVHDESPKTLIFWIVANNAARLNQCYRDIADNFELPYRSYTGLNIFHIVHEWLENQDQKWIIVLDDMDFDWDLPRKTPTGSLEGIPESEKMNHLSSTLESFLPRSINGSVLLTTRNRSMAREMVASDGLIEIEPMTEPLAISLFQKKLNQGSDYGKVNMIVKMLEFHPLAVVQAALLIKSYPRRFNISILCEQLNAQISIERPASHSSPIHVILNITFNHVRQTRPAAFELLSLMSFFEPHEIPQSFLETQVDDQKSLHENDESIGRRAFAQSLNALYRWDQPDTELDAHIDLLADLSLIGFKGPCAIMMHYLVQHELKLHLEVEGLTSQSVARSIKCLFHQLPGMNIVNTRGWRLFFPHVMAMIGQRPIQDQSGSLLQWASLLHRGSRYALTIGETVEMKEMAMAAAEARLELLGSDDASTIDTFSSVVLAYLLLGQWHEAENLAEEQLKHCKHVLGDEHRLYLLTTGQLALAKWYQGRWVEAELPSVKLLEIAQRTLGEEHPDTLSIMSNIAATYDNQGRWDEAEKLTSEVYERRLRILGAGHPDTLTSNNNLAVIYKKQGKLMKARMLILQVLEARRRVLGAEHPDTLSSISNLGSICHAEGRFSEAEELSLQLLEVYKRLRGIQHRDTLVGMENLAKIYRAQGRWDEAEVLAVQVIEGRQKMLGLSHPDTLMSQVTLGKIYSSQRRWDEAEAIQEQVLKAQQMILGLEHPAVCSSIDSLASIYRNQGRLEKANAMYRQLIKRSKTLLGSEHPATAKSLGNLALVLLDQGNFEEAELLQKQSIEVLANALGPEHFVVQQGKSTLASIFIKQKRLHDAEIIQRRVTDFRRRVLGIDHPETLDSMEIFAVLLFGIGQWKEAETLAKSVTRSREKALQAHGSESDATKATLLLQQISNMKLAQGLSTDEDDDGDISELGSVINSLFLPGSGSSNTSLDHSIVTSAVELFTTSLLGMKSFQKVCRFAIEESGYSKKRIQRNLKKALGRFASHLSRESELGIEPHVIKFFHGAQFRVASLIMQSLATRPSGLKESSISRVEEESSRAKVLDYLQTRRDTSQLIQMEQPTMKDSGSNIQGKSEGRDELDSDSDSEPDSTPDAPEILEQTLVDDLQKIEHLIFHSNSFRMMEREFHDFVFPSMRSILFKWIVEKRRTGEFTSTQLHNLEVVVSELQHIPPDRITLSFDEDFSIINTIKGKWQAFTAERWDWWPLSPYMRALANDEARLQWQCACGQARWVEVPLSFAKKVTGAAKMLPSTNTTQTAFGSQCQRARTGQSGQPLTQGQGSIRSPGSLSPQLGPSQQQPQSVPGRKPNRHVFLIVPNSSPLGDSKRLAQISVDSMSDEKFFSWVRSMYYTHRGFFPTWFGMYKYSHCAFFKFERFLQAAYAPLIPEFPGPQQASYHFFPKPIFPDPPISPHEFNHWFRYHSWYNNLSRNILKRVWKRCSIHLACGDVVSEKLPKRDTQLEEQDSSREVFWGLYIVEERSTWMLAVYSVVFLTPSFYFLFAWLFQWSHYGDLQNASVPLSVSIGLLGTFWGMISLTSPRFNENRSKLH